MNRPIPFASEHEDLIIEQRAKIEAEKRIRMDIIQHGLRDFFSDFPKCEKSAYKHRLTLESVQNLVFQYIGEHIQPSDLIILLKKNGYIQEVDKEEYPIRTYWYFS